VLWRLVVPQVLTLIARAHHDNNDHTAARRTLTRGLHMFPTDLKLRFNLAFVLQVRPGGGWVFVLPSRPRGCMAVLQPLYMSWW
jgi:hypothetical protein